jgi:hypothetical protein
MVVDQQALPIAFVLEQLGKSLLDLKKHIKHDTPPGEPAEPFLSSDSLPSRLSSLVTAQRAAWPESGNFDLWWCHVTVHSVG